MSNVDDIALSEFGEVVWKDHEGLFENLTEIAAIREDPWNEYPEVKPDTSNWTNDAGQFIVESNRGIDVAYYHCAYIDWSFQDRSGDSEGMYGMHDEPYKVYRWMELPEGKCEKE